MVDRRSAARLALCGLAFLVCGLVTFRLVYGVDLVSQLASARTYSPALLAERSASWFAWLLPALAAAIGGLFLLRRRPFGLFCGIYLGLAVAIGTMLRGDPASR